jgi:hypothetical protein
MSRSGGIPGEVLVLALTATLAIAPGQTAAQGGFDFPGDRNDGTPVSMFGTYIRAGEFIVYPFYEYYRNHDGEYSPDELGYGLDEDFRAPSGGHEALIFLGYGVSDRLALEFEAALYTTEYQDKSPQDPTAVPDRIEESGLGDVEGQVRWRWRRGTDGGLGIFSFFEYVLPLQKDELLIGTSAWELKLGTGLVRTYGFGTLTFRVAAEYDGEDDRVEAGEYGLEYLKRVSSTVRVFAAVEGSEDEVELIPLVMWAPHPRVALHLNSAFGLTSKAEDWAPEIGVMVSLP